MHVCPFGPPIVWLVLSCIDSSLYQCDLIDRPRLVLVRLQQKSRKMLVWIYMLIVWKFLKAVSPCSVSLLTDFEFELKRWWRFLFVVFSVSFVGFVWFVCWLVYFLLFVCFVSVRFLFAISLDPFELVGASTSCTVVYSNSNGHNRHDAHSISVPNQKMQLVLNEVIWKNC